MVPINNQVIHISLKTSIEKKKKQWLSPTSINAYLRCPRKFYFSKIEKRKQKPSIHLIRGIAVHSAVEKFYKHKINRCRDMAYGDLRKIVLELFLDEWESRASDLIELKLNDDELNFFYQQSEKMMINFLEDFICSHGFDKPDPIVEKTLFSHKYKLLARLDKIERNRGPPIITDFKSSKSKEITEDTKRQMGLCSLLYEEIYKTKPDLIVHFLNFRNGKLAVPISDDYKKYLKEQIANIRHKTQSDDINDYPCKCGWCDKNFETTKT